MARPLTVLGLALLLSATASARPPAAAILTVLNSNDAGAGSLRQAILDSNASVGVVDTIVFSASMTIAPTSALPNLVDPVTIDATTVPAYAGAPLVEIDGVSAGSATGLTINGNGITVKGLAVTRFSNAGIRVNSASATIQACYVGLALDGTTDKGNGTAGIRLDGSSTTVGGALASEGNVISGNQNGGLDGFGSATIRGNKIGTNAAGTVAVPNDVGIWMAGPGAVVTIGGNLAGQGNLVSGNNGFGVRMSSSSTGTVAGNRIGTNAAGTAAVPNGGGILVVGDSITIGGPTAAHGNLISGNTGSGLDLRGVGAFVRNNLIGRTLGNAGPLPNGGNGVTINLGEASIIDQNNVIAHNGLAGVHVVTGRRNLIQGNSIHSNGGLGIQLGGDPGNDPLDTDIGPNDFQNRPVLTHSAVDGGTTYVDFTLQSSPNMTFLLQFFDNPTSPAEGQTLLHTTGMTTGADGLLAFRAFLPGSVPAGRYVTATVTDAFNNTSPFSNEVFVRAEGNLPTVAITDPAGATFATPLASIPLEITASDDVGVVTVIVDNLTNGIFGGATFAAGVWTISVPLTANVANEIRARAYDAAGNLATDTVFVTRDSTAPSIAIAIPTANPTYDGSATPLSVWGTASDAISLVSVTWSNSAGGSGTALGLGVWAAAVPLVEGTNVITVTATDVGGNTATDVLTVEYSPATQTTVVNEGDDCGLLGAEMIGLWLGLAWLRRRVRRA